MHKVLHRKPDPRAVRAQQSINTCPISHCVTHTHTQNPSPGLFLFLSVPPNLPALVSHVSSCLVPSPIISKDEMERVLDGGSETRVLTLTGCVTLGKSCAVFEMAFSSKRNRWTLSSSTFPHPDMPSSLALCHQILKTSHLGPFLRFSIFGSIIQCCYRMQLSLAPSKP